MVDININISNYDISTNSASNCVICPEILTGTGPKAETRNLTGQGPRLGPEIWWDWDWDQGPGPVWVQDRYWDRDHDQDWDRDWDQVRDLDWDRIRDWFRDRVQVRDRVRVRVQDRDRVQDRNHDQ